MKNVNEMLPGEVFVANTEAELDAIRERTGGEKIAVIEHETLHKFKVIGWVDDEPTPLGPEWSSRAEAMKWLQQLSFMVALTGREHLIPVIQGMDFSNIHAGDESMHNVITDTEWLRQLELRRQREKMVYDVTQSDTIHPTDNDHNALPVAVRISTKAPSDSNN